MNLSSENLSYALSSGFEPALSSINPLDGWGVVDCPSGQFPSAETTT